MTETVKTADDYRREIEEQNAKHDQLLTELEIPTYNDRQLEAQWVQTKSKGTITGTSGWTAGAPPEVLELLDVGDPYILETRGFSQITGWIINGRWVARKSDQDLQRDLDAFREESRQRQAVCELAVLYADMGFEILDKTTSTIDDSPAIATFADENGTSGAQHSFALALAKQHLKEQQA